MKINIFQWRYSSFLLLGFGLFGAESAHALLECRDPKITPLTFDAVDAQSTQTDATAEFSITCRSTIGTRAATICVSIGADRVMKSGTNSLNFELFQNPNHTNVWGSQFGSPPPFQLNVKDVTGTSQTFRQTLYGRVLAGQTGVNPGIYEKLYPENSDLARVTVNAPINNTPPGTCNTNPTGKLYVPFTVKVLMIKSCQVTTTGALDLGSVTSGSMPTIKSSNSNLINVTCTNGTPYKIGLSPSNGNVEGMGVMSSSTSTDPVYYQLRSTAGTAGKPWGNDNVASPILSNRVTRDGTGAVQGETVYATVSNTDVKPGTYSDIVTVHVDY